VNTTDYVLCLSDSTAGVDHLAAMLQLPAAMKTANDSPTAWLDQNPKGLTYKDKWGKLAGVTKVRLKTGPDGSPLVVVEARGANVSMPTPTSDSTFFDQDDHVTVQLFNTATNTCWTSEFTTSEHNDAGGFQALVP
jgi:hypothetical protein